MYNMNRVGENVTSIEEYDVATITVSDGIYTPSDLTLVGTMHYSFDSNGKQFRKKYIDADDVTRYLNDLMKIIVSVSAFGQKFTFAFNLSPAFVQKAVEVIMQI